MFRALFRVIIPAAFIILTNCATQHFQKNGLPRAAYELSCPESQLTVHELGNFQFGVEGCGKKVVYVLLPSTGAYVLNSAQNN